MKIAPERLPKHLPTSESYGVAEELSLVLDKVFMGYQGPPFALDFWDNSCWRSAQTDAVFRILIRNPGALHDLVVSPSMLSLAEAYICGELDVLGDLQLALPMADCLFGLRLPLTEKLRIYWRFWRRSRMAKTLVNRHAARLTKTGNSKERVRQAISHHYNAPVEFFALWLDPELIYSCAYFLTPTDTIAEAQRQKLDYLCRKLRLKPGERFLDIGCGWGGLIRHAVEHYGVTAVGVTLSEVQAREARQRANDAALGERCKVLNIDYRDLPSDEPFDKVASIGMVEHVPAAELPGYFRAIFRLLRTGGVVINQGIGSSLAKPLRSGPSFFDKYLFPDGSLVPLSEMLSAAESAGFEVRDVENLREHYALTLACWRRRLEAAQAEIERISDGEMYRLTRLYLTSIGFDFENGRNNLYQILLHRPANCPSSLPLTRADFYERRGD